MPVAERLRDYVHPLVAALRADPVGETDFWARIARERAPLIEPNPAQPGYSIVTYVFPMPPARGTSCLAPALAKTATT